MILGLHHVQIAIPSGGEEAARRFYGHLLGCAEIPKPEPLKARGRGLVSAAGRAAAAFGHRRSLPSIPEGPSGLRGEGPGGAGRAPDAARPSRALGRGGPRRAAVLHVGSLRQPAGVHGPGVRLSGRRAREIRPRGGEGTRPWATGSLVPRVFDLFKIHYTNHQRGLSRRARASSSERGTARRATGPRPTVSSGRKSPLPRPRGGICTRSPSFADTSPRAYRRAPSLPSPPAIAVHVAHKETIDAYSDRSCIA